MFISKLAQIEAKLQAFIEGNAARLFPGDNAQDDLAQNLAAAMWAGVQTEPDGITLAPNRFMIYAHPTRAARYHQNQTILDNLAETLYQSGVETGLRFAGKLSLLISPDPTLDSGKVNILAEIAPDVLVDTTRISLESDAAIKEDLDGSIPLNVFLIVNNTDIFPLTNPVVNLGRSPNNHVVIDDVRVSRFHAQLRLFQGHFVISDLDSTGGTFVNQQRIRQEILKPGDVISLAGVNLVFGQENSPRSAQASSQDSQNIRGFKPS